MRRRRTPRRRCRRARVAPNNSDDTLLCKPQALCRAGSTLKSAKRLSVLSALVQCHHRILRRFLRRLLAARHERVVAWPRWRLRLRVVVVVVRCERRRAGRARRAQQPAPRGGALHDGADVRLPGPHHKRACERRASEQEGPSTEKRDDRALGLPGAHRLRGAAAAARSPAPQGVASRRTSASLRLTSINSHACVRHRRACSLSANACVAHLAAGCVAAPARLRRRPWCRRTAATAPRRRPQTAAGSTRPARCRAQRAAAAPPRRATAAAARAVRDAACVRNSRKREFC